jgi:hypothetical protein
LLTNMILLRYGYRGRGYNNTEKADANNVMLKFRMNF